MPGLTASQEAQLEMQFEYVTWHAPGSPPVVIRRRAVEGIHQEVNSAFATDPHRGAETGGILLGRRDPDRIVVEDFEPIPSEHSFGPSYHLSRTERQLLQETLEWFRGGAQPGVSVLGLYRSQTLPESALCDEDEDLMRAYFAAAEDLVLLVKPSLMETSDADFFICRYGHLQTLQAHSPPPISWPAPRPRLAPEPDRPPAAPRRRRWPWYLAAPLLALLGGALGYLWQHPHSRAEQVAVAPAAPAPDTAAINNFLDRWAAALNTGDVETAAQCYAPLVTTYFTRHNLTRDAVRQSILRARARPDLYRISGIAITPTGDTGAVVTFRKHWQPSARAKPAAEELERMTLVRTGKTWQISSEQAEIR